jgi:hypothetical protein
MLVLLAVLLALGLLVAALAARASGRVFSDRRGLMVALLIPIMVFLVWIAAMSLGVGPALRGI